MSVRSFLIHIKKMDWSLAAISLTLVSVGLLAIYSSSVGKKDFFDFKKQIVFTGLGFMLMVLMSFFDWRQLRENSYLILALYLIFVFLLVGLLFFAPEIRGVRAWYKIGDLSFDPIEFMKIILIILLAKYFSMRHVEMYRVVHILISGFYVFIPAIFIFLQPDLGSVLVLLSLWLGILLISGIKIRHFLVLILLGFLLLVFGWSTILKDYQKARILSFLMPQVSDSLQVGWSQIQAEIAVGSGRIFGQGLTKGSQTQYGFLPEPKTDFIFSVVAEETGLIGVGVLLSLFLLLVWRILTIAISSRSNFCRLFATGFAILLLSQLLIHVGMNVGLLPIIGISLPFVSYGGSSLITSFIGLGILQSIKRTYR